MARFWLASLSRDYYLFFSIVVAVVAICSFFLAWTCYQSHTDSVHQQVVLQSYRLEQKFNDIITDIKRIMTFAGKEISHKGTSNLEHVYKTLKSIGSIEIQATSIFTQISNLDWVDKNGYQVVNLKDRVLKQPLNLNLFRTYPLKTKEQPWVLKFDKPSIGIPSKLWIIPIGLGVTDHNQKYIGAVGGGLLISKLTENLQKQITSSYIAFYIVDENLNTIIHSNDNLNEESKLPKEQSVFHIKDGFLEEPSFKPSIILLYSKKIRDTPYTLLVGYNRSLVKQIFISQTVPRILEFIGMGFFCLILLYFSRKKIIKPITKLAEAASLLAAGNTNVKVPRYPSDEMHKLARGLLQVVRYIKKNNRAKEKLEELNFLLNRSDEEKEEFLRKLNSELIHPLDCILGYTDIMLKSLKGKIQVGISREKQIEFLEKINASTADILSLTSNTLNISKVNVTQIIENCVLIQAKSAFLKNIKLSTSLETDIPDLECDELRLKQILVGLISLSINYTPKGGLITITGSVDKLPNREHKLIIAIIDNGFSLNKEDIMRISYQLDKKTISRAIDGSDLDIWAIERLIKMHSGNLNVEVLPGIGKTFKIILPYAKTSDTEIKHIRSLPEKNIYPFIKY